MKTKIYFALGHSNINQFLVEFAKIIQNKYDFVSTADGVSFLPCSDLFCGPSGGSEPETVSVQNELIRLGPTLASTITVHSYGNMWMFPWGNTVNFAGAVCERADDHAELVGPFYWLQYW